MTDIVLNNITSGYNISKVNDNFNKIKNSVNNDLLNLAGGNNTMNQGIDMNSYRVFNMNDAIAMLDAVNLRQLLTILDQWSQGGKNGVPGMSVQPQLFTWVGDGVTTDIPLPGADVLESSFYDTAIDGNVMEPGKDFTIIMTDDIEETIMRFTTAPALGSQGFTVLRGYARPYSGLPPVTTLNSTITNYFGGDLESTTIDNSFKNALIVLDSDFDTFLTIAINTGNEETDWVNGDFFSVLQLGTGKVEIRIQGGGVLNPSPGFESKTRGQYSIISATMYVPSTNSWAVSGDLFQSVANPIPESMMLVCSNETTNISVANGLMTINMPYALMLTEVRASLTTAQSAGVAFTVDVKKAGTSILSTKITIDNTKLSSKSSTIPPVISDPLLPDDGVIRVDVTQIGTASAKGLKVYLIGTRI